jgi:hypothetical protein
MQFPKPFTYFDRGSTGTWAASQLATLTATGRWSGRASACALVGLRPGSDVVAGFGGKQSCRASCRASARVLSFREPEAPDYNREDSFNPSASRRRGKPRA